MLNMYKVLNPDCQIPVIPGKYSYHYKMVNSIEDIDNIEKCALQMIQPYGEYTKNNHIIFGQR